MFKFFSKPKFEFPSKPDDVSVQMSIAGDEWTNKTLSQRLNDAGVFPSAQGGSNLTLSPQHYKLLCPQGRKILLFPALNTPESGISMAGDEWDNGDLGPYEEVSLAEAGVDIQW